MRKTILAIVVFSMALPLLAAEERTSPPPPAPARSVVVPQPVERKLANGLRVIVIEKKGIPLAAALLMIMTGGEGDPATLAGLAEMTGSLLTKGTKTKPAEEIARGVEA